MRRLPKGPEDLDPAWFTTVLDSSGVDGDVSRVRLTEFAEGVGMMSRLVRVELDYRRGSGPRTVIVKLPCASEENRTISVRYRLYRREVSFYRQVAERTGARTPFVYYAALNGESDFVLVLEDLGTYRQGDQVIGSTLEEASAAMSAAADLHASFWGRADDRELDFIPYHYPSFHADNLCQGAARGWEVTVAIGGASVPKSLRAVKTRYINAIPRMQEWITGAPRTVVHGDFRMDNLFFGIGPEQAPVALVDWQGVLRCKGVHDVAKFLSQSMPPHDRRARERELVARWHDRLRAGGITGYSADRAWQDYRRAVLYLWTYAAVIAGTLDRANVRGRRWTAEMARRSASAIADLGLVELLGEFE